MADATDVTSTEGRVPKDSVRIFVKRLGKDFYLPRSWSREKIKDHLDSVISYTEKNKPQQMQPDATTEDYISAERQRMFDKESPGGKLLAGLGSGLYQSYKGIQQLADQTGNVLGVIPKSRTEEVNQQVEDVLGPYHDAAQNSGLASTGEFVGQVLPTLAMPIAKTIPGAVASGVAAGATQYDPTGKSRAMNALTGGAGGGAFALAARGLNKTINSVNGKIASPAAKEVVDLADKHGLSTLTFGEATSKTIPQKAENMLENVPVLGTEGMRRKGAEQLTDAAENVSNNLREEMINTKFKGLQDLQTAAAGTGKRAAVAKNLLQATVDAGTDWTQVVKTSGGVKAFRAKLIADKLYDDVGAKSGTGFIKIANTRTAIADAIKQESGSLSPDIKTVNFLTKLQETTSKAPRFSQLRELRSKLGSMIEDASSGENALVGKPGIKALSQVKEGIESDIESLVATRPALKKAYDRANKFYATQVAPYKSKALAEAYTTKNADEIAGKFMSLGKEDLAETFYGSLDKKGQAAVRYGVATKALDESMNATTGTIDPVKYVKSLDKIKEAKGVFFSGPDKWELTGFEKLLRHTPRYGKIGSQASGSQILPFLMMTVGTVGTKPLVAAAARVLFTTKPGRNWLLAASDLKVGSPGWQRLIDEMQGQLPKLAAVEATNLQDRSK
jgi:hypothetical protein